MTKHDNSTFRFSWMEFSGSLGDLGLFIPLVVAMTIACDLNIGIVLILAGLMNVLTGFLFNQPIPVQPMKAIAAIAITEGLLRSELYVAGFLMGVVLILCSLFIERINQWVPKAVVRGIQFGVGLKLAMKGVEWLTQLPPLGMDSMLVGLCVVVMLFLFMAIQKPVLVWIFLGGFILLYIDQPMLFSGLVFQIPSVQWFLPTGEAWTVGLIKGVIPQLPLTLLNSVIAVCALSADYFPKKGISPRRMAFSVGLMNIICVPLGGIPMCHGSGGLAAQYRFGARTGGSVIMLGVFKIGVGIIFGGLLLELLQNYPLAILGPMLIFAGLELSKAAQDVMSDKHSFLIVAVSAVFIIGVNTFIGFLVGMLLHSVLNLKEKKV